MLSLLLILAYQIVQYRHHGTLGFAGTGAAGDDDGLRLAISQF